MIQDEPRRGAVARGGAARAGDATHAGETVATDGAVRVDGATRGRVHGEAGRRGAAESSAARGGGARLAGVDAARGLALVGMVAVHTLPLWDEESGGATLSWTLFGGNAAALFATLAGVSLAFGTGGRTPRTGRRLGAARAAVAARAGVIALVGFLLGFLELVVHNILVYYGAFFLLAIPFLGLRIRHLLLGSAVFALLAPVLMQWSLTVLPGHVHANPSLVDLAAEPVTVLSQLLLTGTYPALPWMMFLCAGIAVGRMDLARRSVQLGLAAGGAVLALGASVVSGAALAVFGRDAILRATPGTSPARLQEVVVFGPDPELPTTTLWWLLVPGPHSNTPLSLAVSLGTALCALGVLLLLSRPAGRFLGPLAAMGSMTFTLYTAHLLFLWFEVHADAPLPWFWAQAAVFCGVAVLWRRHVGQGPLEKLVSRVVRGVERRAVARAAGPA